MPQSHILALDADQQQTEGAQRWERRLLPNATPPITHKTILIAPQTLLNTVNEWVAESALEPVPILLIALHACGSLTPDILRSFISSVKNPYSSWYPLGIVAVGCCYNLMRPGGSSLHIDYFSSINILSKRFPSFKIKSLRLYSSRICLPPRSTSPFTMVDTRFRPAYTTSICGTCSQEGYLACLAWKGISGRHTCRETIAAGA